MIANLWISYPQAKDLGAKVGYSAIVLAGGSGRRMGGVLKPLLAVAGESMLHRVLRAVSDADHIVVVGPIELAGHLPARVRLTQEHPAGTGPVAGIAAGLNALHQWEQAPHARGGEALPRRAQGEGTRARPDEAQTQAAALQGPGGATQLSSASEESVGDERTHAAARAPQWSSSAVRDEDFVAVVGGDLPFLSAEALALLRQNTHDVALYVDDEGRRQPMAAVWSVGALVRALAPPVPPSMKGLINNAARVSELPWRGAGMPPWYDCDTPEELEEAERRLS
nr:NTP transferase domain-containing protein [Allorhizocola rhizosphaerae]